MGKGETASTVAKASAFAKAAADRGYGNKRMKNETMWQSRPGSAGRKVQRRDSPQRGPLLCCSVSAATLSMRIDGDVV
jgi:hypothetical protein